MPIGGNHGKKPPNPQTVPKRHGKKPSTPTVGKRNGKMPPPPPKRKGKSIFGSFWEGLTK